MAELPHPQQTAMSSSRITMNDQREDIDIVPAEELIGRTVSFVVKPNIHGQVTGVFIGQSCRTYRVDYYDDNFSSVTMYGFQLILE